MAWLQHDVTRKQLDAVQMQYDRVIAQEREIDDAAERQLSRTPSQTPPDLIRARRSGVRPNPNAPTGSNLP